MKEFTPYVHERSDQVNFSAVFEIGIGYVFHLTLYFRSIYVFDWPMIKLSIKAMFDVGDLNELT